MTCWNLCCMEYRWNRWWPTIRNGFLEHHFHSNGSPKCARYSLNYLPLDRVRTRLDAWAKVYNADLAKMDSLKSKDMAYKRYADQMVAKGATKYNERYLGYFNLFHMLCREVGFPEPKDEKSFLRELTRFEQGLVVQSKASMFSASQQS